MNNFKMGNFLTELRKEKKLTQEELAEKLDLTPKAISRWENGRCMPETKHLIFLANLYGVSVDELIHGQRITKQVNRNDLIIKDYEKVKIDNHYIKLLYFLISISSFLTLFIYPLFLLNKYAGIIYSICLFLVTLSIIAIMQQFRKGKIENLDIGDKTERDRKEKSLLKLKRIYNISLIISLLSVGIIILIYLIDIVFFEPIILESLSTILEIFIPAIWIVSVVPSICLVVIGIKNKDIITAFNIGWTVGNIISDIWAGIFIALIFSPFFAIAFYINAIKIKRKKIIN